MALELFSTAGGTATAGVHKNGSVNVNVTDEFGCNMTARLTPGEARIAAYKLLAVAEQAAQISS